MPLKLVLALVVVVLLESAVSSNASSLADKDGERLSDYSYCGQPSPPSHQRVRRVIGGTRASAHAWPWQVLILNGSKLNCGGSIISPTWLLTSAHCVDRSYNMVIYVGKHHLNETDTHQQKLKIKRYYVHTNYTRGDSITPGDNDMALIHLKYPIKFNPFVHAVCLPDKWTHFSPGYGCMLSGWGATNRVTMGDMANTLRQVKLPLVSQQVCNSNESYGGRINRRYFCAGVREGGKDACSYDSGGPLVCADSGNTWYLTGMVSWGDGCAKPNKYGVFLNITEMMPLIKSKVKDLPQFHLPTPKPGSTTKEKADDAKNKERLFVFIICALLVIILILLITLAAIKYYTKGYVCRTRPDDGRQQQQQQQQQKPNGTAYNEVNV